MDMTIRGIQQAQRWNLRAIKNLQPGGAFSSGVKDITVSLHRYAVTITHVKTGTLRASHRIDVDANRLRGHVYIDPSSTNPRTGNKPADYGVTEEERGGEHMFYGRTIQEYLPQVGPRVAAMIGRSLQ